MSSLAFDKQGKPFAWHKRTAKLRVRLFRNPSARGTCCQVLDGAGLPLFVDARSGRRSSPRRFATETSARTR
jgi:hypothetical protein